MRTFTFFDDEDDLREILGISKKISLWDIGLDMDDWDYGVAFDGWVSEKEMRRHDIGRLLSGCSSNDWKNIETPTGSRFTIGMAYHA